MSHKKIELSSGKQIHIFDDLYPFHYRSNWYDNATQAWYAPTGNDDFTLEHKGDFTLWAPIGQFMNKFDVLDHENSAPVRELIGDSVMDLNQARINLSTLNDRNRFHVDTINEPTLTLLYYLNIQWKLEWGGYTLFADDQVEEIEQVVSNRPGRVVLFDGSIPHCIAAPTSLAPAYRFSLALKFHQASS